MRAVVLAGGTGSRLAPYTTILPKPLMPLGDRPILEIVLGQLRNAGIRDITISVGHLAPLLEAYFGDGSRCGVRVDYLRETSPLGTAGPLANLSDRTRPLLVLNGDVLTDLDYTAVVDRNTATDAAATLTLAPLDTTIGYGVITSDTEGVVRSYEEKPTLRHQISMGIYAVAPRALSHLTAGERIDFPDFMRRLMDDGETVRAYVHNGFWLDIGRREDYERAVADLDTILMRLQLDRGSR